MNSELHPLASLSSIVLVDDNELDNKYHSIVLRKAGFAGDLMVFETGEEFLYQVSSGLPAVDLLLLDINLPGADGFEIARNLRRMGDHFQGVVVVMLTSSPDPGDLERAQAIEIVRSYMTKPLSVEALSAFVQEHFARG